MMRPLGGRERLHRKCMDFFAHAVPQRSIDNLVALYPRFSGKGCGYDHRLKMRAIALHGEMIASEFFADISLYCFWGDHSAVWT